MSVHDVHMDEVGPGAFHRSTSAPKREKSAESIEGAIRILGAIRCHLVADSLPPRKAKQASSQRVALFAITSNQSRQTNA